MAIDGVTTLEVTMKEYFERQLNAHINVHGNDVETLTQFLPTLNVYDFRVTAEQVIIQPTHHTEFYIFNINELM